MKTPFQRLRTRIEKLEDQIDAADKRMKQLIRQQNKALSAFAVEHCPLRVGMRVFIEKRPARITHIMANVYTELELYSVTFEWLDTGNTAARIWAPQPVPGIEFTEIKVDKLTETLTKIVDAAVDTIGE